MDDNLEPDPTGPEPEHRTEPGAPSDYTTLTAILAGLDEDGFGAQFVVREGAAIECLVCRNVSPASAFVVRRSRRLEGASDPDDMVHVVAATCPVCEVGGTVVLTYGTNASLEDGDVSLALDMSDAVVEAPGMTGQPGTDDHA
jgi:hypothetical protein